MKLQAFIFIVVSLIFLALASRYSYDLNDVGGSSNLTITSGGGSGSNYTHPDNITLFKINTTASLSYLLFSSTGIDLYPINTGGSLEYYNLTNQNLMQDTYVDENSPNSNYGALAYVYVLKPAAAGYNRSGLFMVDMSSISSSATITNAIFSAYVSQNGLDVVGEGYSISAVSYLHDWNEGVLTWNLKNPEGSLFYDTIAFDGTTATGWKTFNVTSLLQNCINNNWNNNCTIFLKAHNSFGTPSTSDFVRFDSTEGTYTPYINISYKVSVDETPTNVTIIGNLNITGNLNVGGCINYNGGTLGSCV